MDRVTIHSATPRASVNFQDIHMALINLRFRARSSRKKINRGHINILDSAGPTGFLLKPIRKYCFLHLLCFVELFPMGDQDSAGRHISEAHTHPKSYLSSCHFDLSFSLEDFLSTLRCKVSMGYLPLLVRSYNRSRMEFH
jgi:hypothetical protein